MASTSGRAAEHAHAADRFAREIVRILAGSEARSRQLMGRPLGRPIIVVPILHVSRGTIMPTEPSHLPLAFASPIAETLHPAHLLWERGCAGSFLGLIVSPLSIGLILSYLLTVLPYPLNFWLAISLGGIICSAFQGVFIRKAIPDVWIWLVTSTLSWFGIGFSLFWLLRLPTIVPGLCMIALANGIVSVGQYVIIRGRVPAALQWVLMNTMLGGLLWSVPLVIAGIANYRDIAP